MPRSSPQLGRCWEAGVRTHDNGSKKTSGRFNLARGLRKASQMKGHETRPEGEEIHRAREAGRALKAEQRSCGRQSSVRGTTGRAV